jgi:hypothetical protein
LQDADALLALADDKKQPLPAVHYTLGAADEDANEDRSPTEAAAAAAGFGGASDSGGRESPAEGKKDDGEVFDQAKTMLELQKRLPELSFLWTD